MKIYNSQSEVEKDIKNYELYVDGDVKFNCSISIEASIRVDGDITARDITAWDITAGDITYYAFCCVYQSMSCTSIRGRRGNHHPPICLDGELTIKKLDNDAQEAIKLLEEKGYKIVKIEEGE